MIGGDGTLERLLRWAVGDAEAAEGLLGDLAEEHAKGAIGAWRYRLALLGVALRYAPTRLAEQDLRDVLRAVRFTVRSLARAPSFAIVTVVTLALGIGATGASFTVLRSVVLEPLSYENADRLVRLESAVPGLAPDTRWHLAKAQYRDLQDNATSLEEIGLYVFNVSTIGADDDDGRTAQRARTAMANPSLFRTLSLTLPLGRAFTEQESLVRAPVVILTDGYWERAFGRDPSVLGTTLALDGSADQIVGVLPVSFELPEEASSPSDPVDIWLPLDVDPSEAASNNHVWRAIGRLTPTADVDDTNVELLRLSARLPALFPEAYSTDFMERFGFHTIATPLHEDVVGSTSSTLWIVFGSVGLLLIVACFNTANLVLARAQRRRRELAIRSALGASAGTLVGQLLMESLVLAAAAGVMAIPLAAWATRLLVAGAPSGIPRMNEVALDLPSVGFMLSLCLTAGLVFGLVPARRATRTEVLGEAGRGLTTSMTHHRVRRALVIGQLAVSLVLLSGASLLWQSFRSLTAVEVGLDAESVLTFRVILPSDTYGSYDAAGDFYRRATEQISTIPGVGQVGTANALPLDGYDGCAGIFLEGEEIDTDGSPPCVPVMIVGPGYFEAMGIPVRGATTTWTDIAERRVTAVVSEAFAARFWPGEDALGRGVSGFGAPVVPVAGIVGDVRGAGLDEPAWEALYLSFLPAAGTGSWAVPRFMSFAVRAEGVAPRELIEPVRTLLARLDPAVPLVDIRPMSDIVSDSTARTSFTALLLATASILALLFSGLGVYAVISYIVQGRRSEIGIRLALGAKTSEVQRLVVAQSVRMALLGVLLGVAGAVPLTRLLRSMLFEVSPSDPMTLGGVSVVLVLIAGGAAWAPSRRATRVDPVDALRAE